MCSSHHSAHVCMPRSSGSTSGQSQSTRPVLLLEFVKGIDDAYIFAEELLEQQLPLLQVKRQHSQLDKLAFCTSLQCDFTTGHSHPSSITYAGCEQLAGVVVSVFCGADTKKMMG